MLITLLIKFLSGVHNLAYRSLGILAVKENGGIHPKHRIIQYHQFFIDNISPGDRILDIGCGNGCLAHDLAAKAGSVTAIDISPMNIATAKQKFPRDNITYIVGDATSLKYSSHFDIIILSNVLEHLKHRITYLQTLRPLAPTILIRVPLLERDWLSVYKKERGLEYRLDKDHLIEYTEDSFRHEIEAAGLRIKRTRIKFGELFAVIGI